MNIFSSYEHLSSYEVHMNIFFHISATSSLWLELSSLLQLTVEAILLPFVYYFPNKSLHSQPCLS